MPDYSALVKAIKKAGTEAVNASGPVIIVFGKVISASPLKVLVDQKMTLGTAQLVLTGNVTDYEMSVTVEEKTQKLTIHNSLSKGEEVILLRQQGGQKYIIVDRVG